MTLQFRQRLLSSTLLIGVSALASPAYAAAQPATPQPTDSTPTNVQANPTGPVEGQPTPSTNAQGRPVASGQDIVVTGTRIPQPNLTSAAPVTVVTNQDVKLTGTTRVEDLLNQLPSWLVPRRHRASRTAQAAPPKSIFATWVRSAPFRWSTAAGSRRATRTAAARPPILTSSRPR